MPHPDVPRPSVEPRRWTPPPDPGMVGPFAPNDRLAAAERIPVPHHGPEDVAVAADGTIHTGTEDGAILAISADGTHTRRVATTGGRPLGVEILDDERLLVCDAYRGLLAVAMADGGVEELVTRVDGTDLGCTNNATVGRDGTIWFTDSTTRFPLRHYTGDLLEHSGTGRLCRRDPDGTVSVVLDGLQFANGVALSPDEDRLYVAETGLFRILAVDLADTTPRSITTDGLPAGVTELVSMPGFPDNLSMGPTGTLWCAVASPRNGLADLLAPRSPLLRKAVWSLPEALIPSAAPAAVVFGFDADGTVTHNLQSRKDAFTVATGAREHDGHLYVGSLHADHVLRVSL